MSKKDTVIDYEKVLQHVGPLGLWQFLNLCVLFSVTLCGGIAVVTFAFAGKEIEIIHRLFLVITMYAVDFYRMIIGRLVVNLMSFLYIGNSYKMATFIS